MNADITPERIADHLTGRDLYINRRFAGYVDVSADGAAVKIYFTPARDLAHLYSTRRYRAVVVEGEDAPDLAEVERLKTRLEAAKATMRQALAVDSHPVMAHLLRLYLRASEGAQAEQDGGQP